MDSVKINTKEMAENFGVSTDEMQNTYKAFIKNGFMEQIINEDDQVTYRLTIPDPKMAKRMRKVQSPIKFIQKRLILKNLLYSTNYLKSTLNCVNFATAKKNI